MKIPLDSMVYSIEPNIAFLDILAAGLLDRHDFGDGRARYEESSDDHHDHLIDVQSGKVIEFHDEEVEELQRKIAERHGFKLVDHRMELYGVRFKDAGNL